MLQLWEKYRENKKAKGILLASEIFSHDAFDYWIYFKAAKQLKVKIPGEVHTALLKLDTVRWDKMSADSRSFILQAYIDLLSND